MSEIKLGKLPAKKDKRTFKLKKVLKSETLPQLPKSYDVDEGLGTEIPLQMYGNDQFGNCVIVSRTNWTLRAEYFEQKKLLPITIDEILEQYWMEGGGDSTTKPDNGLIMLDSLKSWRQNGWIAGGEKYYIDAFTSIDIKNIDELKYSVYLLGGAVIGIIVTDKCMQQFYEGKTWDVSFRAKPEGGHAIAIVGWNDIGPLCITWGKKQQMTWAFYKKYTDEAFAIVDRIDSFIENSPVDVEKLRKYLQNIENL